MILLKLFNLIVRSCYLAKLVEIPENVSGL